MDKQEIVDKLFEFFNNKKASGDATEIKEVKKLKKHLCTIDKGIVIDCTDGTEIFLIVQMR